MLTEDQIANLLDNKLTDEELKHLVEQLDDCEECIYQVASSIKLREELKTSEPPELPEEILRRAEKLLTPQRSKRKAFFSGLIDNWKFSIAFVLSIFIGVFIYGSFKQVSNYRANNNSAYVKLVSPVDFSTVRLNKTLFKWESHKDCDYYLFEIFRTNGDRVFSKILHNNSIKNLGELKLVVGGKYLWQVTAVSFNGRKFRSNLNAFVAGN